MQNKKRFHLPKINLQLYDTTGISPTVQHALRVSLLSVTFSMVYAVIVSGAAWTGFQRLLGADAMTLGVLSAIPVAVSTLQLFASYILEKVRARKAILIASGMVNRLVWLPIALIPYIIPMDEGSAHLILLVALLTLGSSSGAFLNVSFYSLMGDMVPRRIYGQYFSARSKVSLVAGIFTGLTVSYIMDRMGGFTGYTVVFLIAVAFGIADICCYFFFEFPAMEARPEKSEGIGTMLKTVLADKQYMRVVGYFTLWFFACNIMGPFINVYFLEHVRMTFTEITLINQIIPNVVTIFIISWWGRQIDHYGNQPVVQLVGLFCMIMPLTYVFIGPRSFMVLPFANAFSGVFWPAADLGQQGMYLTRTPTRNRSMYVAVFFASTQLFGTALSNFVGGLLMSGPLVMLEAMQWSPMGNLFTRYDYIFSLSTLLRIGCVLGLLPFLKSATDTDARVMAQEIFAGFSTNIKRRYLGFKALRMRRKYRRAHPDHDE